LAALERGAGSEKHQNDPWYGSTQLKTPQMCEKEFRAYLPAYNLIRLLMAEVALQAEVLPRQLSFKHTLEI